MGKCTNFGKKKIFLEKATCNICGKAGCVECCSFLFHVVNQKNGDLVDTWYSCSESCFEKIAGDIESQINPKEIIAELKLPPIWIFVGRVVLKEYISQGSSGVIGQIRSQFQKKEYTVVFSKFSDPFKVQEDKPDSVLWNRLVNYTMLIQARHFETLREFENAAKLYKRLGMYEKAGKVRAKRDELTVKKTDISLNLNSLLQQKKDGGIVAIYRCPNCGGKLKVGDKTTLSSLRTCEHCGSEIEAVDLADFLKTALS